MNWLKLKEITVPHGGSMRFWGDWFGRPMDSHHTVVKAIHNEDYDLLTMTFDYGEECTVYSPVGITSTKNSFYVKDAEAVIWSWYFYATEHTKENRYYIQYRKESADSVMCIRDRYYDHAKSMTYFNPQSFYAVEIC